MYAMVMEGLTPLNRTSCIKIHEISLDPGSLVNISMSITTGLFDLI